MEEGWLGCNFSMEKGREGKNLYQMAEQASNKEKSVTELNGKHTPCVLYVTNRISAHFRITFLNISYVFFF